MNFRTMILAALGCVAVVAVLFVLVPRLWPAPVDPPVTISAKPGKEAHGSIDGVRVGTVLTTIARGQSAHGSAISATHEPMTIDGWALTDRNGSPKAVVYRIDEGTWFQATYGSARPDVAAFFKNPVLGSSGFVAHVSIATVATGAHQIHFAVDTGTQLEPLDDPISLEVH